jgi:hypothetical protein
MFERICIIYFKKIMIFISWNTRTKDVNHTKYVHTAMGLGILTRRHASRNSTTCRPSAAPDRRVRFPGTYSAPRFHVSRGFRNRASFFYARVDNFQAREDGLFSVISMCLEKSQNLTTRSVPPSLILLTPLHFSFYLDG